MERPHNARRLLRSKPAVSTVVGVIAGSTFGACVVFALSGGGPATTAMVLAGWASGMLVSCACALGALYRPLREPLAEEEHGGPRADFRNVTDDGVRVLSHEVKTHLNGILGTSEAVLLGYYGDVDEEQREALRATHQSAWNILRLVDSVVRYCRLGLEGSAQESPVTEQRLYDHIEEILLDRWMEAERTGVRIVNSVPRDLRARYRRRELERIVAVLLDNALRFTIQGTIEVLADGWTRGGCRGFQLGVRDTGVGIPPEEIPRVFEPFSASRSSTTPCIRGAGLGLASARILARRLEGTILVDSELGQGSTFTVLVPDGASPPSLADAFVAWPPRTARVTAPPRPTPEGAPRA